MQRIWAKYFKSIITNPLSLFGWIRLIIDFTSLPINLNLLSGSLWWIRDYSCNYSYEVIWIIFPNSLIKFKSFKCTLVKYLTKDFIPLLCYDVIASLTFIWRTYDTHLIPVRGSLWKASYKDMLESWAQSSLSEWYTPSEDDISFMEYISFFESSVLSGLLPSESFLIIQLWPSLHFINSVVHYHLALHIFLSRTERNSMWSSHSWIRISILLLRLLTVIGIPDLERCFCIFVVPYIALK